MLYFKQVKAKITRWDTMDQHLAVGTKRTDKNKMVKMKFQIVLIKKTTQAWVLAIK
jgi:hypothetical protein